MIGDIAPYSAQKGFFTLDLLCFCIRQVAMLVTLTCFAGAVNGADDNVNWMIQSADLSWEASDLTEKMLQDVWTS